MFIRVASSFPIVTGTRWHAVIISEFSTYFPLFKLLMKSTITNSLMPFWIIREESDARAIEIFSNSVV